MLLQCSESWKDKLAVICFASFTVVAWHGEVGGGSGGSRCRLAGYVEGRRRRCVALLLSDTSLPFMHECKNKGFAKGWLIRFPMRFILVESGLLRDTVRFDLYYVALDLCSIACSQLQRLCPLCMMFDKGDQIMNHSQ